LIGTASEVSKSIDFIHTLTSNALLEMQKRLTTYLSGGDPIVNTLTMKDLQYISDTIKEKNVTIPSVKKSVKQIKKVIKKT